MKLKRHSGSVDITGVGVFATEIGKAIAPVLSRDLAEALDEVGEGVQAYLPAYWRHNNAHPLDIDIQLPLGVDIDGGPIYRFNLAKLIEDEYMHEDWDEYGESKLKSMSEELRRLADWIDKFVVLWKHDGGSAKSELY